MMNYDVAVIGAGLAGLWTSRALAARGLRVLLADRKASVTERVHTSGIIVRKTWEDFALPDEQLGPGIRDVTLFSPARRPLHLTADHDEFRIGRMSWIYVYLLEQCCRAGVTWMPSADLQKIEGSTLVFRRERVHARFIVGADGPRSRVASELSLDRNSEFLVGMEEVFESAGGRPSLQCFLDPRLAPGYIAWIADDGVESHVGVAGYRARYEPAQALKAFIASLPQKFANPIERRGGLIPVNGILTHIANERGLLAGDAAGAVSPLTAGGLDGAVRLSALAAETVASYLEGGDASVLREYNGKRFSARFLARRWMRRTIAAADHPLLLELGCAILRLAPFRALARHVFFARGSFPDVQAELRPQTF